MQWKQGCGIVACWGRGEDGALGHGSSDEVPLPKAVWDLLGESAVLVACGAEYTIAVTPETTYSWGWGDFGRLGHGSCDDSFVPKPISFFSGMSVAAVACGDTHTLVTTRSGELYAFGRNQNGQLGVGDRDDRLSPVLVADLKGHVITSVSCGAEHSVVASSTCDVYAWGWGRYGNLGDGGRDDSLSPVRCCGLDTAGVSVVACGWRHSVAVGGDGRIYTFGWSKYGQLGHGDDVDCMTAKRVEGLAGVRVVRVAGGWRHTMAADSDGVLYAWGWNKFGQLGLGDCDDRSAPTVVSLPGGGTVAALACGWRHTMASTTDGRVYSWGRGVNGQLGHGKEEDKNTPTLLSALCEGTVSRASMVATTSAHAMSYVAAADRYAVVPGGDDGAVPSGTDAVPDVGEVGGDGAEDVDDDHGGVPMVPSGVPMVPNGGDGASAQEHPQPKRRREAE
ncbi:hypothetical protein FOA52_004727 [Chlamydomonas sp. UWO 241]|nr:hypothetical protein FOA52_004727 [Chlamydomonas sp. UWO 241]